MLVIEKLVRETWLLLEEINMELLTLLSIVETFVDFTTNSDLWHYRLGHISTTVADLAASSDL